MSKQIYVIDSMTNVLTYFFFLKKKERVTTLSDVGKEAEATCLSDQNSNLTDCTLKYATHCGTPRETTD